MSGENRRVCGNSSFERVDGMPGDKNEKNNFLRTVSAEKITTRFQSRYAYLNVHCVLTDFKTMHKNMVLLSTRLP